MSGERLVDPGLTVDLPGVEDERQVEARCGRARWASSSASTGCASSSAWCSRRPAAAAGCPTTCCCPGRLASGKTTLAMIVAAELEQPLRITSGPAIQHAGDLAAILSSLAEGEVLFLDEIHRMARPAEEMLYLAMEDFRVDVIVGKGPGATAIPLEIPPFTLVGATTRAGLLPGPAARPLRVHRPHGLLRGGRPRAGPGPLGRAARRAPDRRRRVRGGRPVPRHAADRQPAAAPGPRLRPGARRRRRHRSTSPARRCWSTRSTSGGWTGWTGPCCRRSSGTSAAGRWACRRWRWRWARSARPSRRWPSRSWCGPACWPAPRAAGWPPPLPGRTWAVSPPRHLAELPGLFGPDPGEPPPEGGAGE